MACPTPWVLFRMPGLNLASRAPSVSRFFLAPLPSSNPQLTPDIQGTFVKGVTFPTRNLLLCHYKA